MKRYYRFTSQFRRKMLTDESEIIIRLDTTDGQSWDHVQVLVNGKAYKGTALVEVSSGEKYDVVIIEPDIPASAHIKSTVHDVWVMEEQHG